MISAEHMHVGADQLRMGGQRPDQYDACCAWGERHRDLLGVTPEIAENQS
ncbi:MAG: hypothetical protein ACYC6N_27715 [Pirellulaceae bacterium]